MKLVSLSMLQEKRSLVTKEFNLRISGELRSGCTAGSSQLTSQSTQDHEKPKTDIMFGAQGAA